MYNSRELALDVFFARRWALTFYQNLIVFLLAFKLAPQVDRKK